MEIAIFVFNPFAENTFILYDNTGECIIVDPGCNSEKEEQGFLDFIAARELSPKMLVNTHFHIDHVLGNAFITKEFNLKPRFHSEGMYFFNVQDQIAASYGLQYKSSPEPGPHIQEGDILEFGNSKLNVIHVPGHSRGSICLHNEESKSIIVGDVLFRESIGRTDLPGGDYDTLISGIMEKLFVLDPETKVYPGHGPSTTIAFEKENNPFF